MGEQAVKIGKKLEGFGEQLFSGFGWTELTRDREIECKRSSHAKKTHGLDLVMKFNSPYNFNSLSEISIGVNNRPFYSFFMNAHRQIKRSKVYFNLAPFRLH